MSVTTGRLYGGKPAQEEGFSLIEVQLIDDSVVSIVCAVNPSITGHLLSEMQRTGFFHTWNKQESLSVRAERVVALRVTKIAADPA